MHQALNLQLVQNQSTNTDSLEGFRQHIEGSSLDTHRHRYTLRHPQTSLYKGIFCTLGVLMILLSLTVFFKSANWILELHVGYGWFLKSLIGSFAGVMGSLSLSLGIWLKTEHDVAKHIWKGTRRKLSRLYRCKSSGAGKTYWFLFPTSSEQSRLIKKNFLGAREQLHDLFEKTEALLKQITKASFLKPESREQLFNKALAEFQQDADAIVSSFGLS